MLAGTDRNIDVLKHWFKQMRKLGSEQPMLGWVLDEADAYRQIAVDPRHRKHSGIAMKSPRTGEVGEAKFFIMIGHLFGVVSAVCS